MLKDILNELKENAGKDVGLCKVGRIYASMDKETAEAFFSVMNGAASTMDITRALNSEGIAVRRELLGEKRACFRGENNNCCVSALKEQKS